MKDKTYPFQFAESCMFNYLENAARVEALRDELRAVDRLSSAKIQQYEERIPCTGYVDNVSSRTLQIDALESLIADLERHVNPITRLLHDLESPFNLSPERKEMLRILQVRYLHKNTWDRTVAFLKMRRETFAERRKDLVWLAIRYLGIKDRSKVPELKPELKADLFS